jgi:hypothetical protein
MREHGVWSAPGLREVLTWMLFGLALMLVTEPVWRLLLVGFNPTLDDLLQIRCFTRP